MIKGRSDDEHICCPWCKTKIKPWVGLKLFFRYVCGNEDCQKGFFLIKQKV